MGAQKAIDFPIFLYFKSIVIKNQGGISMGNLKNNKKKDEIVIINKFKENDGIDVKTTIENAFKLFYQMKINQFIKSQ